MAEIKQAKSESALLKKVWDIANVLAAAGVGFTDYITQLTYILFLKMDAEKEELGLGSSIPEGYKWADLESLSGQDLVDKYEEILKELAKDTGLIGTIFTKASNKIDRPVLLAKVIEMISSENWYMMEGDFKGAIYEAILEKNGQDKKSGAGQYFTPRALIKAMVDVVDPKITETVADPACGTGGFLLAAYEHMKPQSREIAKQTFLKNNAFFGADNTPLVVTLASMNLYLHDIGTAKSPIICQDSLIDKSDKMFDVVLANPPYSIKHWNRDLFANDPYGRNFLGTPPQGRADYAFIQHILKSMDPNTGRCAILLPHGVLFRDEELDIRRRLVESDLVEAVIGLAPNLFYNSPMEACVMICRSRKSAKAKGRVLFINAVGEVTRKNAESRLSPEHINKILEAYRARQSDGVFAYDATAEEIAANNFSLAISLYAHAASIRSSECGVRSLDDAIEEWNRSANQTVDALDDFKLLVEGR